LIGGEHVLTVILPGLGCFCMLQGVGNQRGGGCRCLITTCASPLHVVRSCESFNLLVATVEGRLSYHWGTLPAWTWSHTPSTIGCQGCLHAPGVTSSIDGICGVCSVGGHLCWHYGSSMWLHGAADTCESKVHLGLPRLCDL